MAKLGKFAAACAAVLCAFGATAAEQPSAYQEVEYIESSGSQYINTEVLPKANTRVVLDFAFTATPTAEARFGWGAGNNGEAFLFGADTKGWYVNISPDWKTSCRPTPEFDLERHVFDVASGSQKFDGTEYGTSSIGNTASAGQFLWLFGSHVEWQASLTYPVKAKVYSCKIYEGATLVCDFVPCYETKENGAIGFYDTVAKKFFKNAGSGTFSKGRDMGADRLLVVCDPAGYGSATPEV